MKFLFAITLFIFSHQDAKISDMLIVTELKTAQATLNKLRMITDLVTTQFKIIQINLSF